MGCRRASIAAGLVAALVVGLVHVVGAGEDQGDGSCLLHSRSAEAARRSAVRLDEGKELPSPRIVVPAADSGLKLRLEKVGDLADLLDRSSPQRRAPVVLGEKHLLIPDQDVGVYKAAYNFDTGLLSQPQLILDLANPPAGFELTTTNTLQNVASNWRGDRVYVVLSVKSRPSAVPVYLLPPALPGIVGSSSVPDLYNLPNGEIAYLTLFEYKFSEGSDELVEPRAIVALQYQLSTSFSHHGGALLTLPDGKLLFATGDSLPFGLEGRFAPQILDQMPSKLLTIDPSTGDIEVVAAGVRNPQHFDIVHQRHQGLMVGFADIGGVTAEEVNFVLLKDLLETTSIENFGWGRNPVDGLAREGTFYVSEGLAFAPGEPAAAPELPPSREPGFRKPYAQYKRPSLGDPNGGFAVAGPVTSEKSFKRIAALFGDLSVGRVYATTEQDFVKTNQVVKQVLLLDALGEPLAPAGSYGPGESLNSLFDGTRVDGRFFRLPDGFAAVLLERTGGIYRLVEV